MIVLARVVVGALSLGAIACGGVVAADAGADATVGDGALGAPCTSDDDCAGALCLGGAFAGGYCSVHVAECDPGTTCADAGLCRKLDGFDVDGAAAGEFCLLPCAAASDCRTGYACCAAQTYALGDASVCAPASLCP